MKNEVSKQHPGKPEQADVRCFLLILLCFFLTSTGYLSWLYHLMDFVSPLAADLLTMGSGYALQAAGIGAAARIFFRRPQPASLHLFIPILVLYTVCLIPSLLSHSAAAVIVFGLLMNLFCGMIAALYLYVLSFECGKTSRAVLFGTGYAAASVAAWLLSLIENGSFLRSGGILFVCFALALVIGFLAGSPSRADASASDAVNTVSPDMPASRKDLRQTLLLSACTVFFLSLVKNIAFNFPSADILSGVSLEFSRLFYAAGLVVAGFITEKNRRYSAIATLAALVTPFLVLSLSNEPVSLTIFWALDYFIYAFFSVYRVLLFSDLSEAWSLPFAAGFGLLFGRLGDAAGTLIGIGMSDRPSLLVLLAVLLFVVTILLFFRLYQKLYPSPAAQPPTEQELFKEFAARYGLSSREQEVLQMLLDKKPGTEIADALFISDRTVKFHIHNLLTKTGCKNRGGLLEKYRRETRSRF